VKAGFEGKENPRYDKSVVRQTNKNHKSRGNSANEKPNEPEAGRNYNRHTDCRR
jgi:hypothetical protein